MDPGSEWMWDLLQCTSGGTGEKLSKQRLQLGGVCVNNCSPVCVQNFCQLIVSQQHVPPTTVLHSCCVLCVGSFNKFLIWVISQPPLVFPIHSALYILCTVSFDWGGGGEKTTMKRQCVRTFEIPEQKLVLCISLVVPCCYPMLMALRSLDLSMSVK